MQAAVAAPIEKKAKDNAAYASSPATANPFDVGNAALANDALNEGAKQYTSEMAEATLMGGHCGGCSKGYSTAEQQKDIVKKESVEEVEPSVDITDTMSFDFADTRNTDTLETKFASAADNDDSSVYSSSQTANIHELFSEYGNSGSRTNGAINTKEYSTSKTGDIADAVVSLDAARSDYGSKTADTTVKSEPYSAKDSTGAVTEKYAAGKDKSAITETNYANTDSSVAEAVSSNYKTAEAKLIVEEFATSEASQSVSQTQNISDSYDAKVQTTVEVDLGNDLVQDNNLNLDGLVSASIPETKQSDVSIVAESTTNYTPKSINLDASVSVAGDITTSQENGDAVSANYSPANDNAVSLELNVQQYQSNSGAEETVAASLAKSQALTLVSNSSTFDLNTVAIETPDATVADLSVKYDPSIAANDNTPRQTEIKDSAYLAKNNSSTDFYAQNDLRVNFSMTLPNGTSTINLAADTFAVQQSDPYNSKYGKMGESLEDYVSGRHSTTYEPEDSDKKYRRAPKQKRKPQTIRVEKQAKKNITEVKETHKKKQAIELKSKIGKSIKKIANRTKKQFGGKVNGKRSIQSKKRTRSRKVSNG